MVYPGSLLALLVEDSWQHGQVAIHCQTSSHCTQARGLGSLSPRIVTCNTTLLWVQAIRDSEYLAPDIDSADLVFVDSHCYIVRRTANLAAEEAAHVLGE